MCKNGGQGCRSCTFEPRPCLWCLHHHACAARVFFCQLYQRTFVYFCRCCIYSHLCRLLANLVSNLWCEVVGFFFMWQDVSLCRGALRSFLCCCQKRRSKMVSDSFVTCYSRPGRGIIFTSSFHNVQMSDSSCTVLLFEPSV